MAKNNRPVNQGFGRVIYLTLIRRMSNRQVQENSWTQDQLEKLSLNPTRQKKNGEKIYDNVTICFDPSRSKDNKGNQKGKLNTRIDFQVKHMGDAGVGNNGFYVTANIDVWNIGPALDQFFDAYNAYKSDGRFKDVQTKKYAAVLQVGFKNSTERTTVFAGHISSFVLDRQQNNSTVDNVWHFLCQYPDPQQNENVGDNKVNVKDGETYEPPEWNATQTFVSWEEYMKEGIAYHNRTLYEYETVDIEEDSESFYLPGVIEDDVAQMSKIGTPYTEAPRVPAPTARYLARKDFDKYFKIEYKVSKNSIELKKVKELWQQQIPISSWNLNVSSLKATVSSIARGLNCHARVELNEDTTQTIYIYPAGWAEEIAYKGPSDYIITDYQNLTKPPQVSANMFHLDLIMEPSMRPGAIIELRISKDFWDKYKHPTFEPSFSMANAATVFAGNNFIGLAQMTEDDKHRNAIANTGNIFNTQFVATIVEHRGSSHANEWTTSVDCYGVVAKGRITSI